MALTGELAVAWVLDDSPENATLYGIPLARPDESHWKPASGPWHFLIAVGRNSIRAKLFLKMCKLGGTPINVIHPKAVLTERCQLNSGIAVMAGTVVNPGARIGHNVVLNTACSVDHDCVVADHAQLCPGVHLGGNVTVGELTTVGTGVSVIPGVRIGCGCEIGAGAVVTRDIPDNSIAVGVPAKVVSQAQ
jgi:sugar O-acyltransferase (sialic acid O-acetyltransferase NeuD family)